MQKVRIFQGTQDQCYQAMQWVFDHHDASLGMTMKEEGKSWGLYLYILNLTTSDVQKAQKIADEFPK